MPLDWMACASWPASRIAVVAMAHAILTRRLAGRIAHSGSLACCGHALALFVACQSAASQDLVVLPKLRMAVPVGSSIATVAGMAASDVNADGIPDLVLPRSIVPGGVDVWLGRGNGTLAPPMHLAGPALQRADAGDITGDGITDIVGIEQGSQAGDTLNAHVWMGLGLGAFSEPMLTAFPYTTPDGKSGQLLDLDLADLNGDGRVDVVAQRHESPSVYGAMETQLIVGSSLGGGVLDPLPAIDLLNASWQVVGDFDSDGLADVAHIASGSAAVYAGQASGGVAPLPINSTAGITGSLGTADFDRDGNLDLAVSGLTPDHEGLLRLLKGTGDGSFASTQDLAAFSSGELATGDIQADGWPDIVVSHIFNEPGTAAVSLVLSNFVNDGAGSLLAPTLTQHVPWVDSFQPRLVDLDVDGALDLLLGTCFLRGSGDGTWIDGDFIDLDGARPADLAAADLDGDGLLDLIATLLEPSDAMVVALGHGDGSFEPGVTPAGGPWSAAKQLAVGDLDGDGSPDLLRTTFQTASPAVRWFSDGTGLSFPVSADGIASNCRDLALSDLNGDGFLDLVAATSSAGAVDIRLSDGQGGLLPATSLGLGDKSQALALADLDLNGTKDILAALHAEGAIGIALGFGDGTFQLAPALMLGLEPVAMAVADFEDDGLPDVAFATGGYVGVVGVYFAQSLASFAEPTLIPAAETFHIEDLDAGDFNGDGGMDLIVTASFGLLGYLRNTGSMTFAMLQQYSAASGATGTIVADLDADDRPDFAVSSGAERAIMLVPNQVEDFADLGFEHAASFGFAQLTSTGEPIPDQTVTFTATGVPAPAVGLLFLGLSFTPQLFLGGTLVPSPDAALPMRPAFPLSGRWPQLPAGTALYAQAWFAVGGEVAGTNAVVGVTQ